jgi:hypothetical protein
VSDDELDVTDYLTVREANRAALTDDLSSWAAYTRRDTTPAVDVDEASVATLDVEAEDEASDKAIDSALRRSDVKAAQQAHRMRKRFYNFVVKAVFGTLAASALTMFLYVISQWGKIDAAVMVAFFSAVVVQVIGLAYIIARYLFAPRGQIAPGNQPTSTPAAA